MADVSSQTLRVLRTALQLATFTMAQLADASGVSYETVKRVLNRDEMFGRTGERVSSRVGRPAELWEVRDEEAIRRRLHQVSEALEAGGAPVETERDRVADETPAERRLAAAEDALLFALRAEEETDVVDFSQQALEELRSADIAFEAPSVDPSDPWARRNLPTSAARAWVVTEVAGYLTSGEANGLAGPLWRRAVSAIAAVESSETSALHMRFLVGLLRTADARAKPQRHLSAAPFEDLVQRLACAAADPDAAGGLRAFVEAGREGSQSDREALRLALADVLDRTLDGSLPLGRGEVGSLLEIVPSICSPTGEISGDVAERLVTTLRTLSRRDDADIALRAIGALTAIHPPRDSAFWIQLVADEKDVIPPAAVFELLGKTDPEAAFAFLRAAIGPLLSLADARSALVSTLPAIDAKAGQRARDALGEFLASLTATARAYLVVTPALAGIEPPRLDRPLIRRFFSALADWSAIVHGDQSDDAVVDQIRARGREVNELVTEVGAFLSDEELTRARDVLARQVATSELAAVSVPAALAIEGEAMLARCVVELAGRTDEPWDSVARWYLDVCPRDDLDEGEREALFDALLSELGTSGQETPFVLTLARRAQERGEYLLELTESDALSVRAGFDLERTITGDYDNTSLAEDLEEIAAAAA